MLFFTLEHALHSKEGCLEESRWTKQAAVLEMATNKEDKDAALGLETNSLVTDNVMVA